MCTFIGRHINWSTMWWASEHLAFFLQTEPFLIDLLMVDLLNPGQSGFQPNYKAKKVLVAPMDELQHHSPRSQAEGGSERSDIPLIPINVPSPSGDDPFSHVI